MSACRAGARGAITGGFGAGRSVTVTVSIVSGRRSALALAVNPETRKSITARGLNLTVRWVRPEARLTK
jgi:hypothetical protein